MNVVLFKTVVCMSACWPITEKPKYATKENFSRILMGIVRADVNFKRTLFPYRMIWLPKINNNVV